MQHTAHHAIITRLNMWRVFFTTGVGTVPIGAPESEYGVDQLVALAIMTRDLYITELAELVNLMADNYTRKMDLDIFDALMQDDPEDSAAPMPIREGPLSFTMEELDAALAHA